MTLPFPTFRGILETSRVEWRNSTPCFAPIVNWSHNHTCTFTPSASIWSRANFLHHLLRSCVLYDSESIQSIQGYALARLEKDLQKIYLYNSSLRASSPALLWVFNPLSSHPSEEVFFLFLTYFVYLYTIVTFKNQIINFKTLNLQFCTSNSTKLQKF